MEQKDNFPIIKETLDQYNMTAREELNKTKSQNSRRGNQQNSQSSLFLIETRHIFLSSDLPSTRPASSTSRSPRISIPLTCAYPLPLAFLHLPTAGSDIIPFENRPLSSRRRLGMHDTAKTAAIFFFHAWQGEVRRGWNFYPTITLKNEREGRWGFSGSGNSRFGGFFFFAFAWNF
jgi:hypothetical protein